MKKQIVEKASDYLSSLHSFTVYNGLKKLLLIRKLSGITGLADLKKLYNGDITREQIQNFNKVRIIDKGLYDYEYFNICFLNNVLSLCLKSVMEGYIPKIEIMTPLGCNLWEQFFLQPFEEELKKPHAEYIQTDNSIEAFPWTSAVYDSVEYWGFVYNFFIKLNETSRSYIKKEVQTILPDDRKVLGVLCRGTDYTEKKPKGHPVQPSVEEIVSRTRIIYETHGYQFVYLATEDSRYHEAFQEVFGERLLVNKRKYYNSHFSDSDITWIKDVHFDRENDDYWKGMEYLSSLQILSKCHGLVAGNCGGTLAAVFWNNNQYQDKYVFDLGEYS